MMARRADNVLVVEPDPVPLHFVTGVKVTTENNHVLVTGWVSIPGLDGEAAELRIVFRVAMTNAAGRDMLAQLGLGIAKGGEAH